MPIYEREGDRARQTRIISLLCLKWNVAAIPTPANLMYVFDYAVMRFDPITFNVETKGIVEIKSRARWLYGSHEFAISRAKWQGLLEAGITRSCPAVLVVHDQETGDVRWVQVSESAVSRIIPRWGRLDRPGDPNAVEEAVAIPPGKFNLLGNMSEVSRLWQTKSGN